ncbi:MAG: glycosyltransferase [Myxococcaceae bacterium]|jgi:dolichyl-phosphate beta-glucosyltransferase|nr:glycosyltransferase [Myxococcaceae bacterium]
MIGAGETKIVVVPCYNEEKRLEPERFLEFRAKGVAVLFVNDGSKDRTAEIIERFAAANDGIGALQLDPNRGKAEAVRHGLLQALTHGPQIVGYLDADLATPPAEMKRVLDALSGSFQVALGSRIRLMGRDIDRLPMRHYLGRIFATAASWSLSLPVYDTQCGAKAFRVTPALEAALTERFSSRWAFDVELIGRLLRPRPGVTPIDPAQFVEVPLQTWHDVKGSKLSSSAMAGAAIDLMRIARRQRR